MDAKRATLVIEGMTCRHCAGSVQRALLRCGGVSAAEVDLAGKRATVRGTDFDPAALRRAVEELGFSVTGEVRQG